jgi:hypothetical protein
MEQYYFLKKADGWVWSGYKFKKGGWQKAMLYKRLDTVVAKMHELRSKGYDCQIIALKVEAVIYE